MREIKSVLGLLMFFVVSLFAACDNEDDLNLDSPPLKEADVCRIDGEQIEMQSVTLANYGEYICIVASPDEGVEQFDDYFASHPYIYVAISPVLLGREFDIKSEQSLFTIISTLPECPLAEVTPYTHEEIVSGTCEFSYIDFPTNRAQVRINATLADGRKLKVSLHKYDKVEVNSNIIARCGEQKPLRAAFCATQEDKTTLYFTPAGVDYFADMQSSAVWYTYIEFDKSLCIGQEIRLGQITSPFAMGLFDNLDPSLNISISNEDLQGATGVISINHLGDRRYRVVANVEWGGESIYINFDGECLDASVVEERANEAYYNDVAYRLSSAELVTSGEQWQLKFKIKPGVITINIPEEFCDGRAVGFSQSADVWVSFGDKVYSKANGYTGTLFVTVSEDKSSVVAEFINNSELGLYYSGAVTHL